MASLLQRFLLAVAAHYSHVHIRISSGWVLLSSVQTRLKWPWTRGFEKKILFRRVEWSGVGAGVSWQRAWLWSVLSERVKVKGRSPFRTQKRGGKQEKGKKDGNIWICSCHLHVLVHHRESRWRFELAINGVSVLIGATCSQTTPQMNKSR
jgi:hypothetical protein